MGMWLVSGVDEEHRFREWTEAIGFYRQMVGDWVRMHGDTDGVGRSVEELALGESHEAEFPDPENGGTVQFSLSWETARVGLDHYTAC
jgi:hypothetical protein